MSRTDFTRIWDGPREYAATVAALIQGGYQFPTDEAADPVLAPVIDIHTRQRRA